MNEYRVSVETPDGMRWLIVEAGTLEAAKVEAQVATSDLGKVLKIESQWDEELDPRSHFGQA
jgi:hypothetical protein